MIALKIMIGKDEWTVESYVGLNDTVNLINFDTLSEEDKKNRTEIYNEKAAVSLGYKRID